MTGGEFDAERLDVGVMAEIATRVPIGTALRTLLADVKPRGVITQLRTRWDGPLDAPEHYRVQGQLSELALAARPAPEADAIGRPGISNAAIQLDATDVGGQARIEMHAGALDLPGVFEQRELPLDQLEARLNWKIESAAGAALPNVTVKVASATFANADAKGELTATWRSGAGTGFGRGARYPGLLELDGKLTDGVAARAARYLPLGLPENVRNYVAGAVREGSITSASYRLHGDLADFPFQEARLARDSDFRINAKVEGLTFAYVPGETPRPARRRAGPDAAGRTRVLAAAHRRLRRARRRQEHARDPRRESGPGQRRVDRHPGPHRRARRPAAARDRGQCARAARGHAALRRRDADRPLDRQGARRRRRHRLGRPQARARGPADARGRHRRQGQHGAGEQRPAHDARHAASRRRPGSRRFHAARLHRQRGERARAGRRARVRRRLERGPERRRFAALQRARHGHRRRPAPGDRTRHGRAIRDGRSRARAAIAPASPSSPAGRRSASPSNLVGFGDRPAGAVWQGRADAVPAARAHRARRGRRGAEATGALRESLQVDFGGAVQAHFVREASGDTSRVVRGAIRVAEPRPIGGDRALDPTPLDPIEPLPLPLSGVAANVSLKRLDVEAWQAALARVQGEAPRPRRSASAPRRRRPPRWSSTRAAAPGTFPMRSRCGSASCCSVRAGSTTSPRGCRSSRISGAPT